MSIRSLKRLLFLERSHQGKRIDRTIAKWKLLEKYFSGRTGSFLDIGCNEGYYAVEAAKLGWFASGLDHHAYAIRYGIRRAKQEGVGNVFLSEGTMTPELARNLPKYDVILMASVFQEIYKAYGKEKATGIFNGILDACKQLFFEPSSSNQKHGAQVFERDNDLASIEKWVKSLIRDADKWKVTHLGGTKYSGREPERHMFLIERV